MIVEVKRGKCFRDKLLTQRIWNLRTALNKMWNQMATCIKRVTKYVLGETKGKRYRHKKTWCWNNEVQGAIKTKCICFK